ncbi:MAG: NUDIX domain-containing protein [bacterium]
MKKFLCNQNEIFWLPKEFKADVETYLSDELPPLELCPSSYALVFKDRALLQTDLREGERPARTLDIPGGHIDEGETPEQAVIREIFEETGVRVQSLKLVAYKKITIHTPKPEGYKYPYPVSYMIYYIAEFSEEIPFEGNAEVHGRVWLELDKYQKSPWYMSEKIMVDEIIKEYLK